MFALTACKGDTSTIDWLDKTVWKADLSKLESSHIDKGEAKLWFTGNGYRFKIYAEREASGSWDELKIDYETEFSGDIPYEFPTIELPFFTEDQLGNPVLNLWKGTFSENRKELRIDEFSGAPFEYNIGYVVFKR